MSSVRKPLKNLQKVNNSALTNKSVINSGCKKRNQQEIKRAVKEINRTASKIKDLSFSNQKKKKKQRQNNKLKMKKQYGDYMNCSQILRLKSKSSERSVPATKNYKNVFNQGCLPLCFQSKQRGIDMETPVYMETEEDRNYHPFQGCSIDCHKMMKQFYQLKHQNQKLQRQKKQLQKACFLKEIEKKQLKRKLEEQKKYRTTYTHHCEKQNDENSLEKSIDKNLKFSYSNKMPFKDTSNTCNIYQSINLKPRPHFNCPQINCFTQKNSVTLKDKQNLKNKNRKLINLCEQKSEINKSSIGEFCPSYIEFLNDEEDFTVSPEFRSVSELDKKTGELQKYFDELVELSRLERNRLKKKQIWKEMKDIANQIKSMKQTNK